jgi:hypothetical protein
MDLTQTIQDLYAHKQKLENALAMLENLQATSTQIPYHLGGKRRGPKSNARRRTRGSLQEDEEVLGKAAEAE